MSEAARLFHLEGDGLSLSHELFHWGQTTESISAGSEKDVMIPVVLALQKQPDP